MQVRRSPDEERNQPLDLRECRENIEMLCFPYGTIGRNRFRTNTHYISYIKFLRTFHSKSDIEIWQELSKKDEKEVYAFEKIERIIKSKPEYKPLLEQLLRDFKDRKDTFQLALKELEAKDEAESISNSEDRKIEEDLTRDGKHPSEIVQYIRLRHTLLFLTDKEWISKNTKNTILAISEKIQNYSIATIYAYINKLIEELFSKSNSLKNYLARLRANNLSQLEILEEFNSYYLVAKLKSDNPKRYKAIQEATNKKKAGLTSNEGYISFKTMLEELK